MKRRIPFILLGAGCACLLLIFTALPALGQDSVAPGSAATDADNLEEVISNFDDDDLESGFDDGMDSAGDVGGEEEAQGDDFLIVDGFLRLNASYNYAHEAPESDEMDFRGLSKLRAALRLELTMNFSEDWKSFISGQAFRDYAYTLNDREMYTDEVLERYEEEAEFREVYLQGTLLDDLDVKLGRQIIVWGKSDNIRITDVLNPVDNREPGLVDIEDIRLPVTMSRLDYYFGDWSLTAVALHEIRFNKDPVIGSDFFPFSVSLPPEDVPADGGENTEYALALGGIFSGWDLAFYWARIFDDQAHFESKSDSANLTLCFISDDCELRHSRITMTGAAFNIALGNWLLRTEAAHFDGLEFFSLPGQKLRRVDVLAGFEYSGFSDTTLTVEVADQHMIDYDPVLKDSPDGTLEDVVQYVFSYRADLLRQTLHVVALAVYFGKEADEGSLQRYSASYDLLDAFSLGGGVVLYEPGGDNTLLNAAQDNDRLFFDAKYSF